jgi:hypothetical protein
MRRLVGCTLGLLVLVICMSVWLRLNPESRRKIMAWCDSFIESLTGRVENGLGTRDPPE